MEGTNFAFMTSFGTSSCVDDGVQKNGSLQVLYDINGYGKDVLLNGYDGQVEDKVVDLKGLHQHQVDLGNLEHAKGIKVEPKGQGTNDLFL